MRRAISLAVSLCFAATCWAGSTPAPVTIPEWVQQLASKPAGTYPSRTDAVVLLDETTITFTSPTDYTQTYRRVVRILRPEGNDEAQFAVFFEPGDKVQDIHAWSINAAGHKFELKPKGFITGSRYGDELYSDDQFTHGEVAGAGVGTVVAFEATVLQHPTAHQFLWHFQESIPVEEARYTLAIPAGWEYKAQWANAAAEEPRSVGPNRWEWVRRNLPGISREDFSPARTALAGRMSLALYVPSGTRLDSWNSIGQWNNGLTADRRNITPEIAEKVRQLTAGLTTFDEKVRVIADFLQRQVRYVAIEIGIGGHQPHKAEEIFRKRYGDCKDKATLMSAMLQAVGISSRYVLIHSQQGVVHPDMPSIYAFNHEILAIDVPANAPPYDSVITDSSGRKLLVFDPTDEFTPLGDTNPHTQGSLALLCNPAGGELFRMPVLDPRKNRRERLGTFVLSVDGALSGEVTERRNGNSAGNWRAALMGLNDAERVRYIQRYFERSLKGILVEDSKFENLDRLSLDLVSHFKVSAQRYAQNTGQLLLVRPRVLGSLAFSLDWKERKFPVQLSSPEYETDTYEIQLPPDYVVDDIPNPVNIDVGFASYSSRFETVGSTVRYSRTYTMRDVFIPLDKLADLRRFQEAIGRDESASVVLQKKPTAATTLP